MRVTISRNRLFGKLLVEKIAKKYGKLLLYRGFISLYIIYILLEDDLREDIGAI